MKIVVPTLLTLVSLLSCGCSRTQLPGPIVVHVFRDATSTEVNLALRAAGEKQLKTAQGHPIQIATMEANSYADGLETLERHGHPDLVELVILDSAADVDRAKINAPLEIAQRASGQKYFLAIPSEISGEQRKAAQLVLANIREQLQKDK